MKNQYDVNLVRNGDPWVIENMLIDNVWFWRPAVVQGQVSVDAARELTEDMNLSQIAERL